MRLRKKKLTLAVLAALSITGCMEITEEEEESGSSYSNHNNAGY